MAGLGSRPARIRLRIRAWPKDNELESTSRSPATSRTCETEPHASLSNTAFTVGLLSIRALSRRIQKIVEHLLVVVEWRGAAKQLYYSNLGWIARVGVPEEEGRRSLYAQSHAFGEIAL